MIDTHCHLSSLDYDNLEDIIDNMNKENICAITNGIDEVTSDEAIELSKNYNNIYSAIGFHPSEIEKISNKYIEYIERNIKNIVAIGEIGLDYHYGKENMAEQKKLFENQLKLAEKYKLPVIVHSRDAIMDTYDILKKYNVRGVLHAFSGSLEMANKFIKLGFKLGIGGVITFKNCNLKNIISDIDIKNIVLETDSPYLSPEPVRGRENTPLNLKYIVDYLANLKKISCEEVINITNNTASTIFDLNSKLC
jgi:TatD DNase family protein